MSPSVPVFPLSALVRQEELRLVLLLVAIDPGMGGVLIRGDKGSAKSTAIRAVAELLPALQAVAGCPCNCDPTSQARCWSCADRVAHGIGLEAVTIAAPLVELPLTADEDALVGTLDLERVLADGVRAFQPGLLARANRGVLYVDEVNLLPDHLVDSLLDAVAMGVNRVEREGVAVTHPARVALAGSMNPEEGDLRPQLLDRFALSVEVRSIGEVADRVEVIRRRMAFDDDPDGFRSAWADRESQLRTTIAEARAVLPTVDLSDDMVERVAGLCAAAGVDGLRADLTIARAARVAAAIAGRTRVEVEDLRTVAPFVLGHRLRRRPFDEAGDVADRLQELIAQVLADPPPDGPGGRSPRSDGPPAPDEPAAPPSDVSAGQEREPAGAPSRATSAGPNAADTAAPETAAPETAPAANTPGGIGEQDPVAPEAVASPEFEARWSAASGSGGRGGRRRGMTGIVRTGRTIGVRPMAHPLARGGLAPAATIRAGAVRRATRPAGSGRTDTDAVTHGLRREDLRGRVRRDTPAAFVLFVVDASGSMGARRRMGVVKGAVLSLLAESYTKRDDVALITFRGDRATLVLPPSHSLDRAARELRILPTGGRTPLAAALRLAHETVVGYRVRHPEASSAVVIVSDGRPNVAIQGGDPRVEACRAATRLAEVDIRAMVVDSETGPVRSGFNARLAVALGADLVSIDRFRPEHLARRSRAA